MTSKIYLLQNLIHYGYDNSDDEYIEEGFIIGYFSSLEVVNKVLSLCVDNGLNKENIDIKCFNLSFRDKKFLYVLTHEYAKKEDDGSFTDYEYIFEPKTTRYQCIKLKEKLIKIPKYQYSADRDYSTNPPDGFIIERYAVDQMVYPIVKKF